MVVQMGITVDDKQWRDFQGRFLKRLPQFTDSMAQGLAMRGRNRLRKEMIRRRHFVSGELHDSTVARKIKQGEWVVLSAGYLNALERGTRGHTIPKTVKTQTWARRHGMSFKQMRRIIAKHGTRPHPFSRTVLTNMRNEYVKEIERRTKVFIGSGARTIQRL